MSHLVTAPDMLATAAAHVDEIASTLRAANAAAAGPTCNLLAAAGDEVSAATAALFSAYGREYQAVVKQAAAFHSEFTRTLEAAGNAYAHAEAANAARVSHALDTINAPIRTLLGRAPLSPNGSSGAGGLPAIAQLAAESPITALIMGGTNNPLPDPEYVTDINNAFIQTLFPGAVSQGLFTPEQFWPVTPDLGNLTFNQSVTEGVALLNTAVNNQLALDNKVVAFGYSQSATIINNYINSLMAMGSPNPDDISFVMIGSGNNPVGGLLARFPGFYIPFLDVPFNGATPANSPYPTHIYTAQYDGIAHAPQFPLRILSDINAFMGYFYVHNTYPELMATQVDNAVPLPTSPGYTGNTQYYMFLTQDLPLLQPIRDIPYAGPPIADLFQPQLRVLVDLGYADYGPGGNYADIPTPAGLFSIPNPFAVSSAAAALFSEYARECQEVLKQAAAFHGEFTRALAAAGAAYAQAEASNTAAMSGTAGSSGALGSVGMLSGNPLTALMMGGTGEPILSDRVLAIIDSAYIRPIFGPNNPVAQYTPEQWWPFIGNLSLDQSIAQGVTLLNNGINAELQNGHDVVVFGYSQSAAVATNEIRALMALPPGQAPDPSRLAFTLIGNINNPNGGVLERYVGLYLPFLDMSFNGATPPDSPYQTYMYTGQYDGYAHNPQYPLNILSDLNAFMGIRWVHNAYPFTAAEVANAVPLPTSPGYTGNTHYYMFLTQDLPLLQPIRAIPFVGTPIAELIQPDLRVLVDLGYGYGYADVPTPASLFAPINPIAVASALATGTVQGPQAALVSIGLLPQSALPNTYPYLPSANPGLMFNFGQSSVTELSVLSGALGSVARLIPPIA